MELKAVCFFKKECRGSGMEVFCLGGFARTNLSKGQEGERFAGKNKLGAPNSAPNVILYLSSPLSRERGGGEALSHLTARLNLAQY